MASRHGAGEKDGSLDSVLTTSLLKLELATIVALCSDVMRRNLLDTFEPMKQLQRAMQGTSGSDLLVDSEADESIAATDEVQVTAQLERLDQSDIQSPRTQGLRRAAITYFDKWQIDVLRRIGDVLRVRPEAVRKARADAKSRAEAAAKAKRDQSYFDWANGEDRASPSPTGDTANKHELLPPNFQPQILTLPIEKRLLILKSVLLLLLSLEHYSAHSRVLMLDLACVFRLPESTLIENESEVAEGLLTSAAAKLSADNSTQRQASQDAAARRWKVGLATIAGAALIGVTGGLAAPFLAAGIGGIMSGIGLGAVATLLGPLATNVVLVGGLFGAYGGRMTGETVQKYTQEIKDFKFLPVSSLPQHIPTDTDNDEQSAIRQLQHPETRKSHKLRVAIGISGSATDAQDFIEPWRIFSESKTEAFGLRWEMDALLRLGRKISEVLQSVAWNFASYQILSMMIAGLWPFGLLSTAKSLDSPFAIAKTRADKAGVVLADALINKVQGVRPVTLVGYGLGARVIHSCLLTLADHNAFGLVESAILMGSPAPSDVASWRRMRSVVSGRVVNVFSSNDFVLGLLYRASSLQMGIAGIQKVIGITGVENFDVTDLVQSHDHYKHLVGTLLQRIGLNDLDMEIVGQQQQTFHRETSGKQIPQMRGSQDNSLAKEIGEGRIVLVDNDTAPNFKVRAEIEELGSVMRKTAIAPQLGDLYDEEDDDEIVHQVQMEDNDEPMSMVAPEPEPDFGPDQETVTFGAGQQQFNVKWSAR